MWTIWPCCPCHPAPPPIGLTNRIRLARDYYVRVDVCDYSVDPRVIGRFVDVSASLERVEVFCAGQRVACHDRSWAKHEVITDPEHRERAAQMRRQLGLDRQRRQALRQHGDGHRVALRALPDYDALFGVDFTPDPPSKASSE